MKSKHTTNASIDELRELRGLAQYTCLKKHFSLSYNTLISLPLNILATKVPPGFTS